MLPESARPSAEEFQLREAIARQYAVNRESIILYQDIGLFLAELFKSFQLPQIRIVTAAPAIAEIAMAADRADAELVECESNDLCAGDIDSLKSKITSSADIIYLANPNRLTGATFANSQLKALAALVNEGLLIIDEYYHDFSGLSAQPLLNKCLNFMVLRAIENWTHFSPSGCGFAIMGERLVEIFRNISNSFRLDRAAAKKCFEIINDRNSCDSRVKLIQKISLQVAKELSGLGIKCQLTYANFILMQVANPGEVQQFLRERDIQTHWLVQNGVRQNFLRLRITASDKDKQIIEAFTRMPESLFKIQDNSRKIKNVFDSGNKEPVKSAMK
jgi:histidinol-phosphate aminotransferase